MRTHIGKQKLDRPLPCAILTKPGSATLPFFGIDLAVLDSITGKEITTTEAEGVLVVRQPWPSQFTTTIIDILIKSPLKVIILQV
ncbi:acetate--CoA ligase [Gigaspora margarita]|nr:acetate--CoA ligase [Gigaspora margarita]